jgi:release factor glutamine methyltransferase
MTDTGVNEPEEGGLVSLRALADQALSALTKALGGDRRQEARWIVERVSGYSSAELALNHDEFVSHRTMAFFDALVARRSTGEPLQYVLGRWQFRQLELMVDRRALIPRPETEWVVEPAIGHLRHLASHRETVWAIDLGTGSGAVACSIAHEVGAATVLATDVSPDALALARANIAGLGRSGGRVTAHLGSWFDGIDESMRGRFDLVFSNPPYVDDDERLPEDVARWEPHLALFGGLDGSDHLRTLIAAAPGWLSPDGMLVLEMAPKQTKAMAELAEQHGMRAEVRTDLTGRPRSICAWPR